MKFTKSILVAVSLFVTPFFAQAASPVVAGELALHRIEKLVQLKRIEEAYITNFQNVTAEVLTQNQPTDPAFRTVVSQTRANNTDLPSKVTMLHNADGKVLSHTVAAGANGVALNWPGKNSLELSESAFHYIEEHSMHHTELAPFDVGFKDLTVTQETRNGKLVAVILLTSSQSEQYAEIVVGTDGVVQSWSLK